MSFPKNCLRDRRVLGEGKFGVTSKRGRSPESEASLPWIPVFTGTTKFAAGEIPGDDMTRPFS